MCGSPNVVRTLPLYCLQKTLFIEKILRMKKFTQSVLGESLMQHQKKGSITVGNFMYSEEQHRFREVYREIIFLEK